MQVTKDAKTVRVPIIRVYSANMRVEYRVQSSTQYCVLVQLRVCTSTHNPEQWHEQWMACVPCEETLKMKMKMKIEIEITITII
jgi:hypothetical protein